MKVYYKLSKLFDIDNILRIITIWVDDFGTASHLKRIIILSTPLLIYQHTRVIVQLMDNNRAVSTNYSITILMVVQ